MEDELSLRDAISGVLRGLSDKQAWKETGEALGRTQKVLPNVAESLVRGGVAAVPGTLGDINELIVDHIGSAFPNAPKAPTTRDILDYVPRISADHEGSKIMEDVGGVIGPGMAGVAKDAVQLTKGMKAGLSIEDVSAQTNALRQVKPAKPEPYRAPRNEMGFYSALDEAVGNIQSPRGTGEQYLKQLQKTPGVKAEEISYRGLDKFLAENPKTSVEDIKKYLSENQVKLEQKTLSGPNENYDAYDSFRHDFREGDRQPYIDDMIDSERDYYREEYTDEWRKDYMERHGYTDEDLAENPHLEREIEDHIDERAYEYAHESAYEHAPHIMEHESGYTITGNDNYGEWTVTDPRGRTVSHGDRNYFRNEDEALEAAQQDALDSGYIETGSSDGVQYDGWKVSGGDDYRENLIHLPEGKGGSFYAPHFDGHDENLLMHNRLTDRTTEGKKTLFSEEMQSDWLQKGRNEGFRDLDAEAALEDKIREATDRLQAVSDRSRESGAGSIWDSPKELQDEYEAIRLEKEELYSQLKPIKNGVPDAPFKKTYHEFLAKKNLNDAVEGGYDRFAWSPGKIHADRYNMNKQVDDIRYYPLVNSLEGYKNKQHILTRNLEKPEDLDMLLGKEFAQRLRETPPTVHPDSGVEYHGMAGEPVDIGDRRAAGMRNYYDEKVPNFLSNYLKKYGVKPGTTTLENGTQAHYVDITPEMKEDFLKRGQPMFAAAPLAMPLMDEEEVQPTQADIAAALRRNP